jgi:hypothetical protein
MAMNADFSDWQEAMPHGLRSWRERDDGHLVKPTGSSADIDPLQELIRAVRVSHLILYGAFALGRNETLSS